MNISANREDNVLSEELDALCAQGWDDHGLFKDDPEALKLFDQIEEERNRWCSTGSRSDLSLDNTHPHDKPALP